MLCSWLNAIGGGAVEKRRHVRPRIFHLLQDPLLSLLRRVAVSSAAVVDVAPTFIVVVIALSLAPSEGDGGLEMEHGVMKTPLSLVGEHRLPLAKVAVVQTLKVVGDFNFLQIVETFYIKQLL